MYDTHRPGHVRENQTVRIFEGRLLVGLGGDRLLEGWVAIKVILSQGRIVLRRRRKQVLQCVDFRIRDPSGDGHETGGEAREDEWGGSSSKEREQGGNSTGGGGGGGRSAETNRTMKAGSLFEQKKALLPVLEALDETLKDNELTVDDERAGLYYGFSKARRMELDYRAAHPQVSAVVNADVWESEEEAVAWVSEEDAQDERMDSSCNIWASSAFDEIF
ncbi:hypothetical protein B0H13DRAFT_1850158 [Mycena leptocephala]|nr:hypothetical protein B0H13DRAFT_1850158 [Mycena leptocephala]